MAGSPWALAALILYPAIQIPMVLFVARWFELDGEGPLPTPTRAYWSEEPAEPTAPGVGHATGQCPRCGVANDPSYAFCRACVARL